MVLTKLKPPVPTLQDNITVADLMQCENETNERKIARTLAAVRCKLRVSPWTQALATEFVGAVRKAQQMSQQDVCVGILWPIAEELCRTGRDRNHPL